MNKQHPLPAGVTIEELARTETPLHVSSPVPALRTLLFLSTLALIAGCSGSGSVSPSNSGPAPTFTASLSASSLTFPSTAVGASAAPQTITLTNTGNAAIAVSSVALSGPNASSFVLANPCPGSIAPNANCVVSVTFTPATAGSLSATLTFIDGANTSPQTVALAGTATAVVSTYTASISPASLAFPATTAGISSAPQTITITNTGTGSFTVTATTFTGAGAVAFNTLSTVFGSTCGSVLAPGASCTEKIYFQPSGSGSYSVPLGLTFSGGPVTLTPSTVTLTGTAIGAAPASATVDCSVATLLCADTFSGGFTTAVAALPTDPIAAAGFHGYADPSERKDPNSNFTYYAYSWAHTLADGTHVVDLHLASSANNGQSFTYAGPLYSSFVTTQTAPVSPNYNPVNDTSTETVDLIPIPLTGASAGQTLWVQAHQSYLVKPQAAIYDQLDVTSIISVSALQLASPTAAGAPAALLGLNSAPEARLGAASTDPTRTITQNLAALSPSTSKCANFGQAALWYQAPTLYLALECSEIGGGGNIDSNELAHFLYSTTPAGADASKWVWAYVAEFATAANALKLGQQPAEGVNYQFFTEPEFAQTKSGQLMILLTPSIFSPAGSQQPVVQYGCRAVPVTALSPSGITLDTDTTTGAYAVLAKVTENDLYTTPNEGPAACTYEPTAVNGIVIGRKFENDPGFGFYLYPVNTAIAP